MKVAQFLIFFVISTLLNLPLFEEAKAKTPACRCANKYSIGWRYARVEAKTCEQACQRTAKEYGYAINGVYADSDSFRPETSGENQIRFSTGLVTQARVSDANSSDSEKWSKQTDDGDIIKPNRWEWIEPGHNLAEQVFVNQGAAGASSF